MKSPSFGQRMPGSKPQDPRAFEKIEPRDTFAYRLVRADGQVHCGAADAIDEILHRVSRMRTSTFGWDCVSLDRSGKTVLARISGAATRTIPAARLRISSAAACASSIWLNTLLAEP